jgi:hypothetical protein
MKHHRQSSPAQGGMKTLDERNLHSVTRFHGNDKKEKISLFTVSSVFISAHYSFLNRSLRKHVTI